MHGEQRSPDESGEPVQGMASPMPAHAVVAHAANAAPPVLPGAFNLAGSLLLVIALVFALAYVLKRVQNLRGAAAGGVIVRAGVQVGARERVLLVEASGRQVLIGVAPGSVRALHVFDPAEIAALPESAAPAAPASPAAFAERLRKLLAGPAGDR